MTRLEIEVSLDGDKWCALLGENLQEGIAGFGNTPLEALANLVGELSATNFYFEP